MIVPVLQGYCRLVLYIVKVIGRTVPFLLPLLAGIGAFEVFTRYVLNSPTIWVYDTSLFLFGYISALGGAYAQQRKAHINVDIIYLKVPKYVRCIFNLITIALAVGFLILLAKMSFEKFQESLKFTYRTPSEWAPEVYHFWLMMTVAAVIFIAEYSAEFIENLFDLFTRTGIGDAMFNASQLLTGQVRGSLAISVIGVCSMIGAMVGIIGAGIMTSSSIALQPMLDRGYDKRLALGVIFLYIIVSLYLLTSASYVR
jgi:TRAP-type C4-dicarboxylate transport system permease small subunit